MDPEPLFQQQECFNFYPACSASYYQQSGNYVSIHGTQHTGATQHTAQYPGTHQHTLQFPRTIHHFSQHPGTNPSSAQQMTTHYPAERSGLSQFSPQHPGTTQYSIPHQGQTCQYTGTSEFPGPPLYTPYLGSTQYAGINQQFEERWPYTAGSQFQQTATQFNSGIHCSGGNSLGNNGALNSVSNNNKVFRKTACSSAQPQTSNADQFGGQNITERPLERVQNVSKEVIKELFHARRSEQLLARWTPD